MDPFAHRRATGRRMTAAPSSNIKTMFAVSIGKGVRDTEPVRHVLREWGEFVNLATAMPNRSDSPEGRYLCADMGGKARCAANAVAVSYIVVDADGFKRAEDAERLIALAEERGRGFSYPTKRSAPGAPRVRLIFEVSRPMSPAELRRASDALAQEIEKAVPGVKLDPRAGDAAQLWFLPARKDADGRMVPVRIWPGAPVNVDDLLRAGASGGDGTQPGRVEAADAFAGLPLPRVEGLTLDDVRPALERLNPESRDRWLRVGFSLSEQFAGTDEEEAARDLWDEWSCGKMHRVLAHRQPSHPTAAAWANAAAAKFEGGDQARTWAGMGRNGAGGISIRSLFWDAGLPLPSHAGTRDAPPGADVGGGFTAPVFVDLGDLFNASAAPPSPRFVLGGLVPAGAVTLLAGHGGTGKTVLSLSLALHFVCGRTWAGHAIEEPQRVLFFSGEDGADLVCFRLWNAMAAYGIASDGIADRLRVVDASEADAVLFARTRDGCLTTGTFAWLANECASFGADVVFIDNASEVFDGDEVDRVQVRQFLRALRALRPGVSVILIAHVDKQTARAGGKGGEGYSGSTGWNNTFRSRLLLRTDGAGLVLEHQKCNAAPLAAPISLRWEGPTPVPLTAAARSEADDQALRTVVRLVADFSARGEHISTATNSPMSVWRLLGGSPELPAGTDRARLDGLVREGARRGLLARRDYRTEGRKVRERWEATPEGRALAEPYPWE